MIIRETCAEGTSCDGGRMNTHLYVCVVKVKCSLNDFSADNFHRREDGVDVCLFHWNCQKA